MARKITLSNEQAGAVDPAVNIVVQANAGTGKTFVLVQRLLRILFREYQADANREKPRGILCLTYTNAGAAEMRNRILSAIMEWARAENTELRELLRGIAHNPKPTDDDIQMARKIFYHFIDNPHALKIQTIHSFCEDILRRFPFEADVPPAWRLVSGAEQKRLLKDTFAELLMGKETNLQDAFDNILGLVSEYSLDALLESILEQYKRIILLKQNPNFPGYVIEKTKKFLNADKEPKKPDFDGNFEQILTKTGDIRKKLTPGEMAVASEVYAWDQFQKNLRILKTSADFLVLCNAFADKYIELKNRRGLLDFDDMLFKTMIMFQNPKVMGQVLEQLDFNLKHILVDEAQDNSPVMWKIIFSMLENFWTTGDLQNPRSLFVVGDIKQSIFSFQGADPKEFADIPLKIKGMTRNDLRQYETVPLLESRRTSRPVLDVMDHFFNTADLAGFPKGTRHKCWREDDFGYVEINPQYLKSNESEELESVRKRYAKKIADKIESLVKDEKIPEEDIMVLVQRRNPFAPLLTRELKRKGIATAGSDRIVLPEFPPVRDLLNLIRFVLGADDPENDAALGFVLRGPVCGFSEKELYDLCAGRDLKKSLYQTLSEKRPDTYKELADLVLLKNLAPFGFLSKVLKKYREKILGAAGRPAIEPLDEFMTLALSYERTKAGGLMGFLRWFLDGENEIRRDMEAGAGVRILTAHSSKGLEAPVVFLIDTTKNPQSPRRQKPFASLCPEEGVFICKAGEGSSARFDHAKEIESVRLTEEYWRLLYVAMSRARDRLYIFGCQERGNSDSWHSLLYRTVRDMPGAEVSDDGVITVKNDVKKAGTQTSTGSSN
ncbi:MAG: UvrD-helicase domain-containing protein [Rickettsiales bacterium]|jgi:ATP-dependent helicase/nuclease subunit A|nr:UvrD-helicase domain-containing protein [Rickettsiales bacterium]